MDEAVSRTVTILICAVSGILISHAISFIDSDWVLITIAIVMMSDKEVEKSFIRGLQRAAGTVVGALICTIFILGFDVTLVTREIVLLFIITCCSTLAIKLIEQRYFFLMVIITSSIILLNKKTGADLIYSRVIDIFVGVFISVAGLLVIKYRTIHQFQKNQNSPNAFIEDLNNQFDNQVAKEQI